MTKRDNKNNETVSRQALLDAVEALRAVSKVYHQERVNAKYHLQQVYTDRNLLVELVARFARQLGYRVTHCDGEEPGWRRATIELPTGTISFNMPSQDALLSTRSVNGPVNLVPDTMDNELKRYRIKAYIRPDLYGIIGYYENENQDQEKAGE